MTLKKKTRDKGKLKLSRFFQKLEEGNIVAVNIEHSLKPGLPKRFQGRTGKIVGKRGKSYVVEIKDQKKEKQFIIKPIHLKKIKQIQNK
jgi:large subunit ribosomal protein L21e